MTGSDGHTTKSHLYSLISHCSNAIGTASTISISALQLASRDLKFLARFDIGTVNSRRVEALCCTIITGDTPESSILVAKTPDGSETIRAHQGSSRLNLLHGQVSSLQKDSSIKMLVVQC